MSIATIATAVNKNHGKAYYRESEPSLAYYRSLELTTAYYRELKLGEAYYRTSVRQEIG